MTNDAELRTQVKGHLESIKNPQRIYELFKKLNYPKKAIFDPSYIKKLSDFELAKEEKDKIKKIDTDDNGNVVVGVIKLNKTKVRVLIQDVILENQKAMDHINAYAYWCKEG